MSTDIADETDDDLHFGSTYPMIRSIKATNVLGEFDYFIEFSDDGDHLTGDRVQIIYAPNGSGKTNLMRATYFACTPDVDALFGLVDIPLEFLRIDFRNGAHVQLNRTEHLEGPYNLEVGLNASDDSVAALHVSPDDFGSRLYRRTLERRGDYINYLRHLGTISSHAVFTGDDRLVLSSLRAFGGRISEPVEELGRELDRETSRVARGRATQTSELVDALDRVESTFQQMAYQSISSEGGGTSGSGVYVSITETIMAGSEEHILAAQARVKLLAGAAKLLERGRPFEVYGLLSLSQVREINATVTTARANNRNLPNLYSIITPYFASLTSRLDALEEAQRLIARFVESVNTFILPKKLTFTAARGITMRDRRNRGLLPRNLSSGEKHLLLLLSNAVLASRSGGLMIIDEPELSLGLEWQRMLIDHLLFCTRDSAVQFLIASHSVQIVGDQRSIVSPDERN